MNHSRRSFVAQFAIAVALCMGGYFVVVEPVREELATARSEARQLSIQVHELEATRDLLPQLSARLEEYQRRVQEFSSRGQLAREERQLFSAIMAAAQDHSIQVDYLNPVQLAPATMQTSTAAARDKAVGFSISLSGDYRNVASFLRTVQSDLGFAAVNSIQLSARADDGTEAVRAVIETVHYFFDPAPLPASSEGQIAAAQGGR